MESFATALLAPDEATPSGLTASNGPADRRFNVYRNNVVVSLIEAMEAGFPVVRALVGDPFFHAMAGEYVRAHPPRSPLMMLYGVDFADFLADFPPVAQLPYLPDTARLEYALRKAFHAADAAPVLPERLTAPDILTARLTLAPALRLIASPYPIHQIWRANAEDGPPPQPGAETVLVTRPGYTPRAEPIAPASARFIRTLAAGETFAEAIDRAGDTLDLAATLAALLAGEAIIDIRTEDNP